MEIVFENVLNYVEPREFITTCMCKKDWYENMEEYMKKSTIENEFILLKTGVYTFRSLQHCSYVLGIGNVTVYINTDVHDKDIRFKNINFITNGVVIIDDSSLTFEDCTFQQSDILVDTAFDISNSNVSLNFCFVDHYESTFMTFENQSIAKFENTIFNNVSFSIYMEYGTVNVFECKFIDCNDCIKCAEKFRIVLRNTHFVNCKNPSVVAESYALGNFVEIGGCTFENSCQPVIEIPICRNSLDIYSNEYIS